MYPRFSLIVSLELDSVMVMQQDA